ncbi:hypothetical protein Fcan01_14325 [Folsomia candida]|uniref:Death domain-containing protein n=1 Tax=Folsomia candida TaxID=158441 RepID=A0A226E0H5_FOLCA|nr:hypothetical protein Fcan01_14325 [Folsomia candida]
MRLMKDFLSDDKNMDALCDSTDLGATLLNFLELKKVITDEILDKINNENGKINKNTILYKFLRDSRDDEDLDHIIAALDASRNSKAMACFVNLRTKKLQSGENSGACNTPSLPPTTAVKLTTMSISKIADLIENDSEILEKITTLNKTFGVGDAAVSSAVKMYKMDTKTANSLLYQILTKWRSARYDADAKGSHFLAILQSAGYRGAEGGFLT